MRKQLEEITASDLPGMSDEELHQYQLRWSQVFEKLSRLEREQPLVKINWDSLTSSGEMLEAELRKRCEGITVLGSDASSGKGKKHFSLLISGAGGHKILLDPALPAEEKTKAVTDIIITQTDEDHIKYLKDYPAKVSVYTLGAIVDMLPTRENMHPIMKTVVFPGSFTITPIKTAHRPGAPSMGIRIGSGFHRISILPEFLRLGKAEKDLIGNSTWIAGCGDYSEDDEEAGKLSFLSLMKLADELKPTAVFLTNIRTGLMKHADEVRKVLNKHKGRILEAGDMIPLKMEKGILQGLYLTPPHGEMIWDGRKKLIVKSRNFKNMVDKPLILVSGKLAYCVLKLHEAKPISLKEFHEAAELHRISDEEREEWWPDSQTLYAYSFDVITRYERPRLVSIPAGVQTFIEYVEFKKASAWGLEKPGYRIFEPADLENTPGFKSGKAVVEAKFDGVRVRVERDEDKQVRIITDPEETETPEKTKRLPHQVKELEKLPGEGFSLDAELVMIKGDEALHRTSVNALINGKFDPTEQSKMAHLYVFDIIELDGESTKSHPLKERKELLAKYEDSEHIHFVRPATSLGAPSLSYIVELGTVQVKNAFEAIMDAKPKFISEGAMVKLLNAPYSGKSWCKWKEKFEIDALVVDKQEIIREGKKSGSYTYSLAVGPLPAAWASAIERTNKKAVGYWDGEKLIADPAELKRLLA